MENCEMHLSLAEVREGLERALNEKYANKTTLHTELEKDKMAYLDSVGYADVAPVFDQRWDGANKEFNVFLWNNERINEKLSAWAEEENKNQPYILDHMIEALVGRIGNTNIATLVKKIRSNLGVKYECKDKSLYLVSIETKSMMGLRSEEKENIYVLTDSLIKAVAIVGKEAKSCAMVALNGVIVDPEVKRDDINLIKISWVVSYSSNSYGSTTQNQCTRESKYIISSSIQRAWELFVNKNKETNTYIPNKELTIERMTEKVIISG
jgi:hypothetical protein